MEVIEDTTVVNNSLPKRRRPVSRAELYSALEAVLPFAESEVEFLNADLGNWPEDAEDARRGLEALESAQRLMGKKTAALRRQQRALEQRPGQADA
jgi:hypothetical protein